VNVVLAFNEFHYNGLRVSSIFTDTRLSARNVNGPLNCK